MNRLTIVAAVLAAATMPAAELHAQELLPYQDANRPVAERVQDLLGRMTLQEKFWQLYMTPGSLDDPSHDYSSGVFGLQVSMPPGALADSSAASLAAA
ncbi:MAG: hypothetical protein WBO43_13545, partial [Gemmatimonadota bacterium]